MTRVMLLFSKILKFQLSDRRKITETFPMDKQISFFLYIIQLNVEELIHF